jgi:transcriptional regulator with PAS, ATPase and Fis domain
MIGMRHIVFQAGRQVVSCELTNSAPISIARCEEAGALSLHPGQGSDPEKTLRAGYKTLSQEHASLRLTPEGAVLVEDHGSTNGTFLRLPPGQPCALPDDAELLFGRELSVKLKDSGWTSTSTAAAPELRTVEDLVFFLRTQLRSRVESVRLRDTQTKDLHEVEDLASAHVATVPLLDSAQQLVVQWLSGTYDPDVDAWLRSIVSVYNSQQSSAKNEPAWDFVAESPGRLQAHWLARRIASTDCTVLLRGATGSGKDVLARDIHNHSVRRRGPFKAVNSAAIPEQLFERELFGHVKGAFTGATDSVSGLFEQAEGGTLFFDEVGDLPLALQAKLLLVLQNKMVQPVGGKRERRVDVRILAATNRALEKMVAEGTFREDLYYRLNTVQIQIPAIDASDVRKLAEVLLEQESSILHCGVSDSERLAVASAAARSDWHGGVRELRSALARYLIFRSPERSVDSNWRNAMATGATAPVPRGPTTESRSGGKLPAQPLTAAKLLDNILFLEVAQDTLHNSSRAGVSEIAACVGMTYQGVVNRLRNLDLKLDGRDDSSKIAARLAEEKASLAPYVGWLRTLLP